MLEFCSTVLPAPSPYRQSNLWFHMDSNPGPLTCEVSVITTTLPKCSGLSDINQHVHSHYICCIGHMEVSICRYLPQDIPRAKHIAFITYLNPVAATSNSMKLGVEEHGWLSTLSSYHQPTYLPT